MASGFPGGGGGIGGGGGSDFFSGRSIMNNPNNNSQPQNNPYRTQLSQIFLDSSSQIAHHQQQRQLHHSPASSYIGKRSLSEYQSSYYQPQQSQSGLNPALNAFLARSVKPRICQNQNPTTTSPISTLSPIEFSANNFSPELPAVAQHQQQQRYGFPLLQQLRPQPINISQNSSSNNNNPQFQALQGIPFANSVQSTQPSQMSQSNNRGIVAPAAAPPLESEKKMMNRLQELEKQLLDDDDDDKEDEDGCGGGDAVSVITNTNSEWSETIQNLISPSSSSSPTTTGNNNNNNNPISPSSSSSTTSSTTTSAATPAICTRPVLMEAAAAIYEGKSDSAAEILSRVGSSGGKGGNSEQRLMDYLFSALKSRVNPAENPPPVAELYGKEHVASTQLLFERSPCFKLGFMAANLAILESTLEVEEDQEQGKKNKKKSNGFHVVDFDIGQGGQYVNLLYALAERLNGSTAVVVKITAVPDGSGGEEERQRLNSVGEELRQLAERLGITLRFSVAASCKQLGDLSRESLGCEAEEPLAVNFAFKLYRMADESVSTENPRDELLRRVRAMEPRVVTVVEQEMNGNTAPFLARVNEACGYYGALLESIEATVPSEAERGRVEEGVGRKLANAVACEGRDRVERCEVFGKWRARMGMAGFKPKPLSQTVTESMRARLQSANWANPGFTVKEDNGGACFGWMGKSLTVASAWR